MDDITGYMEEVYSEGRALCVQSIEENLSEDLGQRIWVVGVAVAG